MTILRGGARNSQTGPNFDQNPEILEIAVLTVLTFFDLFWEIPGNPQKRGILEIWTSAWEIRPLEKVSGEVRCREISQTSPGQGAPFAAKFHVGPQSVPTFIAKICA